MVKERFLTEISDDPHLLLLLEIFALFQVFVLFGRGSVAPSISCLILFLTQVILALFHFSFISSGEEEGSFRHLAAAAAIRQLFHLHKCHNQRLFNFCLTFQLNFFWNIGKIREK